MFIAPDDDLLRGLEGATVRARAQPEVEYRVERRVGSGSYSIAFFALRRSPDGESPVVLKFVRPSLMRAAGEMAILAVEKETVALGRLNERVPPTPFVVRLHASDAIDVEQGGVELRLPWLALEYVHGGAEGTTLEERVEFSVEQTGYAFDPDRADLALTCLASGLEAIHEVGVVHRDLSPHNVLCCGFGHDELFKIADFGIARPQGGAGTFAGIPGGTPGYAAPEQVRHGGAKVCPESDVFSLAAITFKLLTGEDLFSGGSVIDAAVLALAAERRSITKCKALCPELAERPGACAAIDRIIARGTAADPRHRPPTGWELVSGILRALRSGKRRSRPPRRRLESITDYSAPMRFGWTWRVRHQSGGSRILRCVAWDADGRGLAATTGGLVFWNGTGWVSVQVDGLPDAKAVRFVERVGAGTWLIGGDGAFIAHYSSDGATGFLRSDDPTVSFTHASGDLEDLAVLVAERPGEPPLLFGLASRRWMKPAALSRAKRVNSLARIDDEHWLIADKSKSGEGFAAIYSPLMFEVNLIAGGESELYTGCSGRADLGLGAAVGGGGRVIKVDDLATTSLQISDGPDLAAVAVDVGGRIWAASAGSIWLHEPGGSLPWKCVWQNDAWNVPFVGVFADVGRVVATARDGGVVEGRWEAK
ncbi:MAG: serine/threonine protein kinase [Myxococcales bacterium]|nr:serine/threonine protein kinase [Myxococcales bacterium]